MAKGKKSLDSLISDLETLEKDFDSLFLPLYDKIVATIFRAIGQATAFDTGVARSLIQSVLMELGHMEMAYELYPVVYEFWNSVEKRLNENPSYKLSASNGRYSVEINDYGFSNQAVDGELSVLHPRSNAGLHPHQVDYGIDLAEAGADPVIERAFAELEKAIIRAIERGA